MELRHHRIKEKQEKDLVITQQKNSLDALRQKREDERRRLALIVDEKRKQEHYLKEQVRAPCLRGPTEPAANSRLGHTRSLRAPSARRTSASSARSPRRRPSPSRRRTLSSPPRSWCARARPASLPLPPQAYDNTDVAVRPAAD
jgi:hypothetical protein